MILRLRFLLLLTNILALLLVINLYDAQHLHSRGREVARGIVIMACAKRVAVEVLILVKHEEVKLGTPNAVLLSE